MNIVILSAPGRDDHLRDELHMHLRPLVTSAGIDLWHDGLVAAGEDRTRAARERAGAAHIVIILVTADFLALQQTDDELSLTIAHLFRKSVWLFPVLARHCLHHLAPFYRREIMTYNGGPIAAWPDRDEAWTHIAAEIERLLYERPPAELAPHSPCSEALREAHNTRTPEEPREIQPPPLHDHDVEDTLMVLRSRADPSPYTLYQAVAIFPGTTLVIWAEQIARKRQGDFDIDAAWNILEYIHLVHRSQYVTQIASAVSPAGPSPGIELAEDAAQVVVDWLESADEGTIEVHRELLSPALYGLLNSIDLRDGARIVRSLVKRPDMERFYEIFIAAYPELGADVRPGVRQFLRHAVLKRRALKGPGALECLSALARKHCPRLVALIPASGPP